MERTIKVVLVSRPSIRGYSRWEYRVVECRERLRDEKLAEALGLA